MNTRIFAVESDVAGGGVELLKQVLENDKESSSVMERSSQNQQLRTKFHGSSSATAANRINIQSEFQKNQYYLDRKSLHSLTGEVLRSTEKISNKNENLKVDQLASGGQGPSGVNSFALNDPRRYNMRKYIQY